MMAGFGNLEPARYQHLQQAAGPARDNSNKGCPWFRAGKHKAFPL